MAYAFIQHGLNTFDLQAILQECDNLQATFNKMMYKTHIFTKLKLKMENR